MATDLKLDPKYDNYDFPVIPPHPAPGHPGNLSATQEAQIAQLRMKLEAEGYTERLDTLTLVSLIAIMLRLKFSIHFYLFDPTPDSVPVTIS